MRHTLKKFFPPPETPVLIITNRGLAYEKQLELIYLDFGRVEGLSPDLVKFRDPADNSIVILNYRDINEWRY